MRELEAGSEGEVGSKAVRDSEGEAVRGSEGEAVRGSNEGQCEAVTES